MSEIAFFRDLEMQLLRPETRTEVRVLETLLASDFCEFGVSGAIYNRQEVIESLVQESPCDYQIADFSVHFLGDTARLLTYRCTRLNPASGEQRRSLRSSIWHIVDGDWKLVFHQGTFQAQSG